MECLEKGRTWKWKGRKWQDELYPYSLLPMSTAHLHTCKRTHRTCLTHLPAPYRTCLPQASIAQASWYMHLLHLLHLLDDIQCLFFPPLPRRIPFLTELTLL